jgi:hypothetical protein
MLGYYRAGSLMEAARELARYEYKLDLVGMQEVRWNIEGTERRGVYKFSMERTRKSSIWNRIFVHHRIVPVVTRVEFVSHRGSYRVLTCRWCNIIVLNVHTPSEEK